MPGFLGSEAAFNAQFGKALKTGRASKTGSSEAQTGLLAMEGLHKQATLCLPCLLVYALNLFVVMGPRADEIELT